ncbi:hypothetical protein [Micromonospora sp. NBC_01412]|uniref:hypothetical protein n=1 Tax=Micromonospora sp. NBC_01412 TaxID=2903590 RepID=UPI0032504E2E
MEQFGGGHLHDHQRVQALRHDGVEVEEVDGQQAGGLVAQEGTPVGVLVAGRWADMSAGQDSSIVPAPDVLAQPLQFVLDSAVSPAWVLAGQP